MATAEISIKVVSVDVRGSTQSRELTIAVPHDTSMSLPAEWLAIDFGTSALAVAFGTSDKSEIVNLQRVVVGADPDRNFADLCPVNLEKDGPFLPSMFCCDADDPLMAKNGKRPGFPTYSPRRLTLGDPAFVALPPTRELIVRSASMDRIVFSLKTRLACGAVNIRLPSKVKFTDGTGIIRYDDHLPLKDLGVSAVRALLEGYVKDRPEEYEMGGFVVCHPNSFSALQKRNLKAIFDEAIRRSYGPRFNARVNLVSESDAAALSYIARKEKSGMPLPERKENLLIYDFGAGTTDITILEVRWHDEETGASNAKVKGRFGVNAAGNHLDQLIAGLVDDILQNDLAKFLPWYRHRIVRPNVNGGSNEERTAMINLWEAIKQAKIEMSSRSAGAGHYLDILVGEEGKPDWIVAPPDGKVDLIQGLERFDRSYQKAPREAELVWHEASVPPALGAVPAGTTPIATGTAMATVHQIYLRIPSARLEAGKLDQFCRAITISACWEAVELAGLQKSEINVIVPSGRGVLFPLIRERLREVFGISGNSSVDETLLDGGDQLAKKVVVEGALRHAWLNGTWLSDDGPGEPKLALLCNRDQLIREEDWGGRAVDITRGRFVSVVQYALGKPNSVNDLSSEFRHFYTRLGRIKVADLPDHMHVVRFKKYVTPDGRVMVEMRSEKTGDTREIGVNTVDDNELAPLPWPVGRLFLSASDDPEDI